MARFPLFSAFQGNAFTWNLALGMTNLLVPLYARDLGMSGVSIGSLIALPVLIQIWFNLLGGAYADRIGAKRTSLFASMSLAIAAAIFALSASFPGLLAGQFLMILSRAAFWPSNWALASQLPGDRSRNMGRLNATTNAGQIVGLAVSGMLIARFGFRSGFWTMAVIGLLALLFAFFIAQHHAAHSARPKLFATYAALLKHRTIYLAVLCAYVAALPFSLAMSFFPILLVEQGFSSETTGWLLAFRAVGSIVAGVALAHLVRHATDRMPPFAAAVLSAVSVSLVAVLAHPLWAGLFLLSLGAASGVMTVYFQILISTISSAEQRASAMALGGLGWGLSHLSTPLLVGAVADAWGIRPAFYLLGAIVLLVGTSLPSVQRWAFGAAPRQA